MSEHPTFDLFVKKGWMSEAKAEVRPVGESETDAKPKIEASFEIRLHCVHPGEIGINVSKSCMPCTIRWMDFHWTLEALSVLRGFSRLFSDGGKERFATNLMALLRTGKLCIDNKNFIVASNNMRIFNTKKPQDYTLVTPLGQNENLSYAPACSCGDILVLRKPE